MSPEVKLPFWRSLKGKFIAFFLIIDVATLAVMALAVGIDATDAIALQVRERLQQSTRHVADSIAEDIRTKWTHLRTLAQNTLVVNAAVDTLGRDVYLRPFINKLRLPGRGGEFPYIAMLDYRGRLIADSASGHSQQAEQPWLAAVLKGQEYGGVFVGADGNSLVRFAFPVISNAQVEAVLLSEFPLAFIDDLRPVEPGTAMALVDEGGRLIFGTAPEKLLRSMDWVVPHASPQTIAADQLLHSVVDLPYPQGQEDLRWHLVLSVDQSAVAAPVTALIQRMLLVGGFIGLALTVLVAWRARRFVRPLSDLQQAMRQIMAGADMKSAVNVAAKDEVGALGATFNQMIVNIDDKETALHAEVSVRRRAERELIAANQALTGTLAQLRATQAQLVQSEKMASLGQLAAGVAHEINNPIGFVTCNLHSLRKYCNDLLTLAEHYEVALAAPTDRAAKTALAAHLKEIDFAFLREDLPTMIDESDDGLARVTKIVADLKDFAHPDSTALELVDLNDLLDKTINVAWNELKYKAELRRDYGHLPLVNCWPGPLGQVFLNLLINAAQAITDRGEITVATAVEGDQVVVTVADTGCGIAPEIIGKIFDPFFTTKPIGQGTGLGLHIAYSIIDNHGGHLSVDSEPSRGTAFTIRLPTCGPPQTPQTNPSRDSIAPTRPPLDDLNRGDKVPGTRMFSEA